MINAVQDVPVGPVEVDYRRHQHQRSIGEQLEGDDTSKEVNVQINLLKYDKNFLILNFLFRVFPLSLLRRVTITIIRGA